MPTIQKPEVSLDSASYAKRPYVDGSKVLANGEVKAWTGACVDVFSPIYVAETGERAKIGRQAVLTTEAAVAAVEAASKAWAKGRGPWATKTLKERIAVVESLVEKLKEIRSEIVSVLQWEICKNDADAAKEFDRTMEFVAALIVAAREMDSKGVVCAEGVHAIVRRSPVGVMLNLGPSNYPFNEAYATLIPALLMGNSVVMQLHTGGLAHCLTMEAYAECFPAGVVNFVSGRGQDTMPPIMETGLVDILAFIGSSKAADALVRAHPQPHRLKSLLSLDAKNVGVILPDADLDVAATECLAGSTSYNGQRCTAVKLIIVHKSVAEEFNEKLCAAVSGLAAGLPFGKNAITPLVSPGPQYMNELVEDAKARGATVLNQQESGGHWDRSLFFPAVVYPVTSAARLWREEQFGPVIPIAMYESIDDVYEVFIIRSLRWGMAHIVNLWLALHMICCMLRTSLSAETVGPDDLSSDSAFLQIVAAPPLERSKIEAKGERLQHSSAINSSLSNSGTAFLAVNLTEGEGHYHSQPGWLRPWTYAEWRRNCIPHSGVQMRVRSEITDFVQDSARWQRFRYALLSVKASGVYDRFTMYHMNAGRDGAHRGDGFLPWHRMFLDDFETELQKAARDCFLTVPYWNSPMDAYGPTRAAIFHRALFGDLDSRHPSDCIVNGVAQGWDVGVGEFREECVRRNGRSGLFVGEESFTLPTWAQIMARLRSFTAYDRRDIFGSPGDRYTLRRFMEEAVHDGVHVAIGGEGGAMSDVATAAADPVFYCHHAFIDRVWNAWQQHLRGNWESRRCGSCGFFGVYRRARAQDFVGWYNPSARCVRYQDRCVRYESRRVVARASTDDDEGESGGDDCAALEAQIDADECSEEELQSMPLIEECVDHIDERDEMAVKLLEKFRLSMEASGEHSMEETREEEAEHLRAALKKMREGKAVRRAKNKWEKESCMPCDFVCRGGVGKRNP